MLHLLDVCTAGPLLPGRMILYGPQLSDGFGEPTPEALGVLFESKHGRFLLLGDVCHESRATKTTLASLGLTLKQKRASHPILVYYSPSTGSI